MFVRHIKLIISCILLSLATSWGILVSSQSQKLNANSLPHPQKLSTTSVQPNIVQAASVKEAVTVAQPQPQPPPLPAPIPIPPPPPPPISEWQGDLEPISVDPAQIPVLSRIPTDKPVVFLGIDDGLVRSTETFTWLVSHKLPFTLFLEDDLASKDYDYFREIQDAGMTIQDHTISHADLSTLNLEQQKAEICGSADKFQTAFGTRPTLFRPPYGSFNDLTKQAAAECGMKALIVWHAKANGGSIQFQDGNTHFLPGDIVLMHFRQEFLQDMQAFEDQVVKDHLQVGRLEDWIQ
jgi:peptidoglycan/xylan/chitin deacetylase (PgdA/CDA1 family)